MVNIRDEHPAGFTVFGKAATTRGGACNEGSGEVREREVKEIKDNILELMAQPIPQKILGFFIIREHVVAHIRTPARGSPVHDSLCVVRYVGYPIVRGYRAR